ncbi:MAG: secretin N-terminal domain-containing protein [Acidobacteriota bacterium]
MKRKFDHSRGVIVNMKQIFKFATLLLVVLFLASCAAQNAYRKAEKNAKREDWDKAVIGYSKALAMDPGNTRYSVALARAKIKASAIHFEKGKKYLDSGQIELAIAELQQTVALDPSNQYAFNELEKAMKLLEKKAVPVSEIEEMKARAKREALAPPKLNPRSQEPIAMKFKEETVGKIYDILSKVSGINFIYDDKVDLQRKIDIDLANISFEKAMDILMMTNKHFYKVIDENTLLIAPDNKQKRQEYEDNVIRTFYLSNADPKQVSALVRTLLNTRQIADNSMLNSITIKDTPEKVEIAEKIIEANDKSKAEIIIDVELLEINRKIIQNLGLDLTAKTIGVTYGAEDAIPMNNLRLLKQQSAWLVGPIPGIMLDFLKSDSDTKTISKPQLRVAEGEKAEIHIGDRVPIPTTTFSTAQTIGGNIVPLTSFTYQNVGIELNIEPRVHHNKEITLKVQVKVSSLTGQVTGSYGVSQPIIGERDIKTVIRLKDGETNMLAGLIKKDDINSLSGVPGVSDLPFLGRIFGKNSIENSEMDIVLTLTPHIIRIPDIREDDLMALWVGTDENMRLRGSTRNAAGETPFSGPEETPIVTIQQRPAAPGAVARPRERRIPEEAPPPKVEEEALKQPEAEEPESPEPLAEEPEKLTGMARVSIVPSKPTYSIGDTISLSIVIEGASNVGSVPFHLRFNPQVLEFVPPGIEGNFLNADGTSTVFIASESASGGEIIVGISRIGSQTGASGSGTLCVLQFLAVSDGPCSFEFSGQSVKDPKAQNLRATFSSVNLVIQPGK